MATRQPIPPKTVYNPTTNGWDGTDKLDVTLTNGSKWVGAAQSSVEAIGTAQMYGEGYSSVDWRALSPNSIWPDSTYDTNGHVAGEEVYQSGSFNVTLNNGSEWDTRKPSNIDTLAVNNQSQVNVENSGLLADSITPDQRLYPEYWRQRCSGDRQPVSGQL